MHFESCTQVSRFFRALLESSTPIADNRLHETLPEGEDARCAQKGGGSTWFLLVFAVGFVAFKLSTHFMSWMVIRSVENAWRNIKKQS